MAGVTFSPTILLGQNASAQSDTLKTVNRLKEVVVRGYGAERNLKAPEMGRVSLSSNMIANLPVMFGEPDIVKALQTLPGVSQGMEGFTGLYVRGGDNDQNLFLYQGLPLYHVSHLGGIFSSFNVETVDRVDFYKASFPARYGGRISSITDIAMREPDFNKFGGKVSVGLLNANVYVTGPIIKGRTFVTDLDIAVSINGEEKEHMTYDANRHLYVSNTKVIPGESVTVSTRYRDKTVKATDVMPEPVVIEGITVSRQGPMQIYTDADCVVYYNLTFTDKPGDSYYFLQWDNADGLRGFSMGERNFTHEYVFQQLANQIHSTLPGWKPYSPYGLPFSDKGFDGQKRTIEVREIIQLSPGTWRQKRMARKFWLYAISKPYYDYLVSSIINRTDNKGIQGGLIDLGLADPVKIFSNVDGGVGIVGCYTSDSQTIDVIKEIGPFPKY